MRRKRRTLSEQVEAKDERKPERKKTSVDPNTLIPTGSTMQNLVQSDRIEGGWQLGKIENLVGDSSAGKSFLALSGLAECCHLPRFDDYRLIYDDVEQADEFDHEYLFGDLQKRLEAPGGIDDDGDPVHSDTVQDFHFHVLDALKVGKPFIYVLDSLDLLTAEEDQKKIQEQHKAHKKGQSTAGTYGMAKPKYVSWMLRDLKKLLKESNSMVLIVSQTRANIDPRSFEKKTRSGGTALKFASCHETWMAVIKKHKSKGLVTGVSTRVKCKKNKITGKIRDCDYNIYYDYGIDDIGSCVDFLVKQEVWKKRANTILSPDLDLEGGRDGLIRKIERNGLETDLKQLVQKAWNERENSVLTHRKPRF